MKLNYNYDEAGFFAGVSPARIDPVATRAAGEERYLQPRNSTHSAPPEQELLKNQKWRWMGDWVIYTDPDPIEIEVEEVQA